ncbi:MAG: IS4 family transposase [Halomonas sp.]|uniref:IS4 family transposase n=1 Tax=Halomonas sp. TaxID=1486246 RepID=UPI002ACEA966|nr:IS4 family transposase [Halomonas sp.]MDZ7852299.1 IS4 family transposase [Halomonas sp.]
MLGELDLSSVTTVGVDETATQRGHRYVTVFLDMQRKQEPVLFAVLGHGKEAIKSFRAFLAVQSGNLDNVVEEACDMSQALLSSVADNLPAQCRNNATPILVTDAGFRNPWFQAVEARGWYYVGRVRSPTRCQIPGHEWQPVADLFPQATSESRALGAVQIAESNPLTTYMVLYHRPPQGRKHRNKRGLVSQDSGSRAIARRQKEPWVLVSNLPARSTLADKLVAIYRQRMQIEEGFRDVKSPLFGLGFGMHQSRQGKRIEILLLIAMLANVAVMIAGLQVRDSGQQQRYQSNSIRHRNVLSVWRLGLEWLRRHRVSTAPWPSWKTLQVCIQEEVREQALCNG